MKKVIYDKIVFCVSSVGMGATGNVLWTEFLKKPKDPQNVNTYMFMFGMFAMSTAMSF